jgi:hypothetical protein
MERQIAVLTAILMILTLAGFAQLLLIAILFKTIKRQIKRISLLDDRLLKLEAYHRKPNGFLPYESQHIKQVVPLSGAPDRL